MGVLGRRLWDRISIHALLAESDRQCALYGSVRANFYPRSPCGERPAICCAPPILRNFYPRSPCGERLRILQQRCHELLISIHALLAESDLAVPDLGKRNIGISIHALLAESDPKWGCRYRRYRTISIHALLAESDP